MSKVDVLMLSFGWFFVGLLAGGGQLDLIFAKAMLVLMPIGTVLALLDA